jgi:hypothetical protein
MTRPSGATEATNRGATWKVLSATVDELESQLNRLAGDGYEIYTIQPMGHPDPLSNVPRERKTLEARTTFAIVAFKQA